MMNTTYIDQNNCERITVLRIDGVYSSIVDEAYIPKDNDEMMRDFLLKYSDEKYMCIKTI